MFGSSTIDTIVKILLTIALAPLLIAILPISPFQSMVTYLEAIPEGYIHNINWFIPISSMFSILSVWAIAILSYYAIAWILRQLDIVSKA